MMNQSIYKKLKNRKTRRTTDTDQRSQSMIDSLVNETKVNDDSEKSGFDNMILHKYMHPVEQFMIQEDSKFFNDHLDNQMVNLLNDIMQQEQDNQAAAAHNECLKNIQDRLVSHIKSIGPKEENNGKPENALMKNLKAKMKSQVEDKKKEFET